MQWHYCVVHVIYTDKSKTPDDGKISVVFYNEIAPDAARKDEAAGRFGDVDSYITRLGMDGWELVNVVGTEQLTSFYFKRPAAGS